MIIKTHRIFVLLLLLMSLSAGKDFAGAEYRTKEAFTYGRFEVRYKSSAGAGQTSTFFTYHELGSEGTAAWNEIDIEILGRYDNDVQFNPITPGQINHVYHRWVGFDPSEAYHVYAFEWTPEYVAWFIDGEEAHRQTGAHIEQLNREQKIMMNIWPPQYKDWVGTLDSKTLPLFAYYDYVSYAAYTPGNGDTGTEQNFTFQWKDDFDEVDYNRWEKATHTFQGNNCDFVPENVVFRDGKLILCLTEKEVTGYTDQNPPFAQWAMFNDGVIYIRFSEELDRVTAENPANYLLRNGGTLESIELAENLRTVVLKVVDYDPGIAHDILTMEIRDRAETPNTCAPKFVNIYNPPIYNYPLKINVGGAATGEFLADQEWNYYVDYGYISGISGHSTNSIANTENDQVFQSELRDIVAYKVHVPNGIYEVEMLFSENYFEAAGKRIFDINLEGKYAARNLDIFTEAGKSTAFSLKVPDVIVTDGIMDFHFGASQDVAFLHGLMIRQISTKVEEEAELPRGFRLEQNYPNPFNGSTTIKYNLTQQANTSLTIYDLQGREVFLLVDREQKAGEYEVKWRPAVASGIYFLQLQVSDEKINLCDSKKMVYLK